MIPNKKTRKIDGIKENINVIPNVPMSFKTKKKTRKIDGIPKNTNINPNAQCKRYPKEYKYHSKCINVIQNNKTKKKNKRYQPKTQISFQMHQYTSKQKNTKNRLYQKEYQYHCKCINVVQNTQSTKNKRYHKKHRYHSKYSHAIQKLKQNSKTAKQKMVQGQSSSSYVYQCCFYYKMIS